MWYFVGFSNILNGKFYDYSIPFWSNLAKNRLVLESKYPQKTFHLGISKISKISKMDHMELMTILSYIKKIATSVLFHSIQLNE